MAIFPCFFLFLRYYNRMLVGYDILSSAGNRSFAMSIGAVSGNLSTAPKSSEKNKTKEGTKE